MHFVKWSFCLRVYPEPYVVCCIGVSDLHYDIDMIGLDNSVHIIIGLTGLLIYQSQTHSGCASFKNV